MMLVAVLLVAGAWDDFPPPRDVPRRAPHAGEVAAAYDDVARAIAGWQAERQAFQQERHAQRVVRDVLDLKALPWPDTRDVEVVRSAGARGGGKPHKVPAPSSAEAQRQAELDAAEARAEDYRRRCAEDPVGCARGNAQGRAAREDEGRERQAELERREQDLARRQQALEAQQRELEAQQRATAEEAEKRQRALERHRRAAESQGRQNDAVLRGVIDALSDE
jgi:hypothetical protein